MMLCWVESRVELSKKKLDPKNEKNAKMKLYIEWNSLFGFELLEIYWVES